MHKPVDSPTFSTLKHPHHLKCHAETPSRGIESGIFRPLKHPHGSGNNPLKHPHCHPLKHPHIQVVDIMYPYTSQQPPLVENFQEVLLFRAKLFPRTLRTLNPLHKKTLSQNHVAKCRKTNVNSLLTMNSSDSGWLLLPAALPSPPIPLTPVAAFAGLPPAEPSHNPEFQNFPSPLPIPRPSFAVQ